MGMSASPIDGFEGVHGGSGFGARKLEGEVLLEVCKFPFSCYHLLRVS